MSNQKDNVIMQQTELLKNTTEMTEYLDILKTLRSKYMIILCVKDNPGRKMFSTTIQQIQELGFTKFSNRFWIMYAGIIYKSEVLLDKSGMVPEMPVYYEGEAGGCQIEIVSESYLKENRSVISINGNDYSMDGNGVNIVVYDVDNNELVDSISFDTHKTPTGIFARGDLKTRCKKIDIEGVMLQMYDELNALSQKIDTYNYKMDYVFWNNARLTGETSLDAKKRFLGSLQTEDKNMLILQKSITIVLSEFGRICEQNDIDYWLDYGTLLGAARHSGSIPWDDDVDVCMMRKDLPKLEKAISESDTFIWINNFFTIAAPFYALNFHRIQCKNLQAGPYVDIHICDYCDSDSLERWQKFKIDMESFKSQLYKFSPEPKTDSGCDLLAYYAVTEQEHINEITAITNKIFESNKNENEDYVIMAFDSFSDIENKPIFKTSDIFPLKELKFNGKMYKVPNQYERYLEVVYGDIYSLPNNMLTHIHIDMSQKVIDECTEVIEKYSDKH